MNTRSSRRLVRHRRSRALEGRRAASRAWGLGLLGFLVMTGSPGCRSMHPHEEIFRQIAAMPTYIVWREVPEAEGWGDLREQVNARLPTQPDVPEIKALVTVKVFHDLKDTQYAVATIQDGRIGGNPDRLLVFTAVRSQANRFDFRLNAQLTLDKRERSMDGQRDMRLMTRMVGQCVLIEIDTYSPSPQARKGQNLWIESACYYRIEPDGQVHLVQEILNRDDKPTGHKVAEVYDLLHFKRPPETWDDQYPYPHRKP